MGGIKTILRNLYQSSGSSSGFAAEWDASTLAFPSGTFAAGDMVKATVSSDPGLVDGVFVPAGAIGIAMQANPTSDWNALTGWKLI